MILSDKERYTIVLSTIRDYESGVNDIGILLIEKVVAQIGDNLKENVTTQDIFDEVIETVLYYNDFITEKNINLKKIPDEMIDLVEQYINEVVEDVNSD